METNSVYNQDFANRVAKLCNDKFNKLPKTGKPNVNESQWTLLAGICLEGVDGNLSVVALGTGTKSLGCKGYSKLGDVVHDSHAEVLTRRAWLRYLYSQMNLCLTGQTSHVFNPIPEDVVEKYRNGNTERKTEITLEENTVVSCARTISDEMRISKLSEDANVPKEDEAPIEDSICNTSLSETFPLKQNNNVEIVQASDASTFTKPCGHHTLHSLDMAFSLRPGVKFHFYTSHTPCGDASIFPRRIKATTLAKIQSQAHRYKAEKDFLKKRKLVTPGGGSNISQDDLNVNPCKKPRVNNVDDNEREENSCDAATNERRIEMLTSDCSSEDSGPDDSLSGDVGSMVQDFHRTGAKVLPQASHKDPKGTGPEYHLTGVPRTKPGRGDPTYSMSCSDKIVKWNAGALISTLLTSPIYMASITVGGGIAFSMEALERALITRVAPLIPPPHPVLLHAEVIFPYGKRCVKREMKRLGRPISFAHPVGGCIIWCNVTYRPLEIAIEGIKQGVSRKIHSKTNATSTLLISPYKLLVQYIQLCKNPMYVGMTHAQIKEKASGHRERMKNCKRALGNWLDVPEEFRQFRVNDMDEVL